MPTLANIFEKFEKEIKTLEEHLKHSKLFESNMNNFFNQIKNLTVSNNKINSIFRKNIRKAFNGNAKKWKTK